MKAVTDLMEIEKAKLQRGLKQGARTAALGLLATAAALTGVMMMLVGGYASLFRSMEPWRAGLLAGGSVLLLALIMLAVAGRIVRPAKPFSQPPRENAAFYRRPPDGTAGPAAAHVIGQPAIKTRDLALGALVAGLALGASPRLRHQLFRLIFGRRKPGAA
jgi:hypothetical protein